MMLSGTARNRSGKWESRLLFLGIIVMVILSIWFVWKGQKTQPAFVAAPGAIYCDAERVVDGLFVSNEQVFASGNWQTDEVSHSGDYACKIPVGNGLQYALTTTWGGVKAGQIWQISIWHLRQPSSSAKLVVKATDNSALYAETAVAVRREGNWEQYQITLRIPSQGVPVSLQAYVYSDGRKVHFFDDFSIEQTRLLAAREGKIPHLYFQVEPREMSQLERKRSEALTKGVLIKGNDDWVNAQMRDSTAVFSVKMRLKGDWTDHLEGDKWSFRIATKKDVSWNRLKVFSVHTPSTRYHLHEWLLHQFWKREGILTTYYDFVLLSLNEKELGVYALEEHFEKQLLERQHRREGPIIRLSEAGFWEGISRQLDNHGYQRQDALLSVMDRKNADVTAFNEKALKKDTTLNYSWKMAAALLSAFQKGNLDVTKIFDIDKLAKYYAIADIFNAAHALTWHNQRFYYNPILGRLEPIGYDGFGGRPERRYRLLGEGGASDNNPYFHQLLANKAFLTLYYRYMYKYSDPEYFGQFIAAVSPGWETLLPLIQSEFPTYQYQLDDFSEEAAYVHSLLLPFDDFSVKATRISNEDSLYLSNRHHLALQVVGFGMQRDKIRETADIWLSGQPSRRYLRRIQRDKKIDGIFQNPYLYQEVEKNQSPLYNVKVAAPPWTKYVYYSLPGVENVFSTKVEDSDELDSPSLPSVVGGELEGIADFCKIVDHRIYFKAERITISNPIIIPRGYEVYFPAGGTYDFIDGAYLMSYSPITVQGTAVQPVLFESSDHTGGGVSVFQTKATSDLTYALFDGFTNYRGNGRTLTGAVNFYEATILMEHCIFKNNHCEDALNVVRSNFQMKNCLFSNTQSDAFDSDFSKGKINHTRFVSVGNDALDCSGSIITLRNCQMEVCGDKGLSAGEESDITVFDTEIKEAPIAFAAKDLSVLFLNNVKIKDCRQGFVAFQKKPEYGGGHIVINGYETEAVVRLSAIGAGSSVDFK